MPGPFLTLFPKHSGEDFARFPSWCTMILPYLMKNVWCADLSTILTPDDLLDLVDANDFALGDLHYRVDQPAQQHTPVNVVNLRYYPFAQAKFLPFPYLTKHGLAREMES